MTSSSMFPLSGACTAVLIVAGQFKKGAAASYTILGFNLSFHEMTIVRLLQPLRSGYAKHGTN